MLGNAQKILVEALKQSLDHMIELWARWCHNGQQSRHTSILQIIMSGHSFSGGSGSAQPLIECCELTIESALSAYVWRTKDQRAVEIWRIEHGVLRVGNLPTDAKQHDKALKLGVGVSTYRRKLKLVREEVIAALLRDKYL